MEAKKVIKPRAQSQISIRNYVFVYQNKHERFGILGKMIYFCKKNKRKV